MATPEQNALLALQLFGAPAAQFNQQNDAKTNLAYKLMAMQREEQLKRDMATQGYDKAIELATMQGTREDARWKNADTRLDTQLTVQQKLAATRADQSDAKQLRSLISKTYHEYALEAEEAGIEIQPRDEFPDDDEGLGALTVAYAKAKKANQRTKQKGIAQLAGAELTAAADEFKLAQTQLQTLAQPNEDDNEQAKLIAVANVQKAIQGAAKPPPPTAVKNGLAALDRGDLPEAKKLLGAEIFSAYESGFQQALRGLLNTPARRQQITEASRAAQGIQARLKDMTHSYRVGAAQNPELAAEVVRVLTPLERMMQELPKAAPTYDQNPLLNVGGGGAPAPGGGGTPAPTGDTSPKSAPTAASNYKYPGLSILGLAERVGANLPSGGDFAMAPANIAAFPGRLLDTAARYGAGGLYGLYDGNYFVPEKGPLETAGAGIGRAFAVDVGGETVRQNRILDMIDGLIPRVRPEVAQQLRTLKAAPNLSEEAVTRIVFPEDYTNLLSPSGKGRSKMDALLRQPHL